MNARIDVLVALHKTARTLRGAKDPLVAIEAAKEEIRIGKEIDRLRQRPLPFSTSEEPLALVAEGEE